MADLMRAARALGMVLAIVGCTPPAVSKTAVSKASVNAHVGKAERSDNPLLRPKGHHPVWWSRPHVTAFPIVVRELPTLIPVEQPLTAPPKQPPEIASDVFVTSDRNSVVDGWPQPMLRTTRYLWGSFLIGSRSATVSHDAERGATRGGLVMPNLHGSSYARWEGLRRKTGPMVAASYEYEISEGWLHADGFVMTIEARAVVPVKTIIEDRLFAFRQCQEPRCIDPVVALIAPQVTQVVTVDKVGGVVVPDSRILVHPKQGESHTLVLERTTDEDDLPLLVEIQQSTAEREPIITAFSQR